MQIIRLNKAFQRNELGQFIKGTHWRSKKPYWDKIWLQVEYITNFRTIENIAKQFNITEAAIRFWLVKHSIPRRTTTEIRKRKYWGLKGSKNGMYGRLGKKIQDGMEVIRQKDNANMLEQHGKI